MCKPKYQWLIFLLALIASTTTLAVGPPQFQYTYRDPLTDYFWQISTSDAAVSDGHLIVSIPACPENTKCIMAGLLQFAIPSDWQNRSEWVIQKKEFKKAGARELSILGNRVRAFLITSNDHDVEYWYLMAPREGLIAFGAKHVTGPYMQYWNEAKCGFAADKSCR